MLRLPTLCALLCAFSVPTTLTAQPSIPPAPPAMTTGSGYLFVLQDGVVYQYNINSLRLLRSTTLGAAVQDDAFAEVDETEEQPMADEPIAEEEIVEEAVVEEIEEEPAEPTASGAAVQRALGWLKQHQDADGRWDSDGFTKHDPAGAVASGAGTPVYDVGVTALATLAFLGDGSTVSSGPHQDVVRRALAWLVRQQDEDSGLVGTTASHDFIYSHAIAAVALCEGYMLSKAPQLRVPAQRAINYLESHRNPYAVWRYQPRDNDNDTSVTGWAVMAYRAGQDAGLDVNRQALMLAKTWYEQITDPATGVAGYTKRGEPSSRNTGDHAMRFPVEKTHAMTASALFARFLLGQTPQQTATMRMSADRLIERLPAALADHSSTDFYYWFFGSYATYQMGGDYWRQWARALPIALGKTQRTDGNLAGSWDPQTTWGEVGGRIYATALATLTMESYYRYTRLVGARRGG